MKNHNLVEDGLQNFKKDNNTSGKFVRESAAVNMDIVNDWGKIGKL